MAEPKGFLVVPAAFNPSGDLRALELDASDYLKVALAAWLEGAVDVKGYTGSAWKELLVNASGQAIVVGKGTSEEVNAALLAPARALVGAHGYIGGAWQKQAFPFGYSAFKGQNFTNNNLAAGTNNMVGDTVPAGEIWVLQALSVVYGGLPPTLLRIDISDGTTNYPVLIQIAPASGSVYLATGQFVVPVGGNIRWHVEGATLNDDLYGLAFGYRVDIDL